MEKPSTDDRWLRRGRANDRWQMGKYTAASHKKKTSPCWRNSQKSGIVFINVRLPFNFAYTIRMQREKDIWGRLTPSYSHSLDGRFLEYDWSAKRVTKKRLMIRRSFNSHDLIIMIIFTLIVSISFKTLPLLSLRQNIDARGSWGYKLILTYLVFHGVSWRK